MGSIWKWKLPWVGHWQMASQPGRGNFVAGGGEIWLSQDTQGSSWTWLLAWVPPAACHQLLLALPLGCRLHLFSLPSHLAAIFLNPQHFSAEVGSFMLSFFCLQFISGVIWQDMNLMWTLPIGVFWRLFNSEMSPSTVEESSYKGPPTLLLSSSPSLPVLSFCACCEHHRLLLPSALCKPVFPCLLSVVFFCPENCCASLGLGSCVVLPGGLLWLPHCWFKSPLLPWLWPMLRLSHWPT